MHAEKQDWEADKNFLNKLGVVDKSCHRVNFNEVIPVQVRSPQSVLCVEHHVRDGTFPLLMFLANYFNLSLNAPTMHFLCIISAFILQAGIHLFTVLNTHWSEYIIALWDK